MKTAVTDMFGIDVPILAFTHCRDVVAAVTKAGGLGVLGAVAHSQEQLEIDLAWIEAEVGGRPYGIDLIVPAKYAGDGEGGFTMDDIRQLIPAEHKAFVDDILRRYDVPPLPDDEAGLGRGVANSGTAAPFSANQADPLLEIALAHRPVLVVNALGPPPPHMIDRVKQEGRLLGALAGKAQHAQRHVNAGVDLIIAQGAEAGGHTGEVGTMVLIPEIVDAVGSVPVVGAGGIGRGRQMAAAMALGAQGVWCGSVWLTTNEAETHPVVKQKFL
ncbi:MAG: nitronate monooxygenase, partial [Ilumatobacteraceae bacterium]|nr:nitronate monooxygenase [Ilumatobacteraceae bacterium]